MEEREAWRCLNEHDGIQNPLCEKCRSLMSSSGMRQAATGDGFVHSSDLFTPPPFPYLWDVEKISCPLCKACFSLRNQSRQLCPQPAPSEGVRIFCLEDTKHLRLQISLDLRFSSAHFAGCYKDICILADQDERIPAEYGILSRVDNLAGGGVMFAAKAHLDKCVRSHERCRAGTADSPVLPTRLLDLVHDGHMQEPFCRLVESKQGERARYACLSYCWGEASQRRLLTKSKKQHFTNSMRIRDFSQCIQDAIKVLRMVGVRYLWVDALCIVQDDEEDVAAELSRMKDIFKNATFVLAAASSSDQSQGFLEPRLSPEPFICDFPALVEGRPVKLTIRPVANYYAGNKHDQVVDSGLDHPLNKRAWTLQECVLARRLLVFSNFEVFWHCQEITDKPVLPSCFGLPRGLIPWDRQKLLKPLTLSTGMGPQWLPLWFQLVEDYMRRNMTKPSDSINALQGVVKEVEIETGDKFVFGLSTRHFLWSLLWHVPHLENPRWEEASEGDIIPAAPSWSWAAQKWPVTMNLCLGFTAEAQVTTAPEYSSGTGEGTVQLHGKMKRLAEFERRGSGVIWRDPCPGEETDEHTFRESGILLYLGYSRQVSRDNWLHSGMTSGGENLFEFFLVLEHGSTGRFRRIGLYHLGYRGNRRPFPDDWTEMTVWVD